MRTSGKHFTGNRCRLYTLKGGKQKTWGGVSLGHHQWSEGEAGRRLPLYMCALVADFMWAAEAWRKILCSSDESPTPFGPNSTAAISAMVWHPARMNCAKCCCSAIERKNAKSSELEPDLVPESDPVPPEGAAARRRGCCLCCRLPARVRSITCCTRSSADMASARGLFRHPADMVEAAQRRG